MITLDVKSGAVADRISIPECLFQIEDVFECAVFDDLNPSLKGVFGFPVFIPELN